MFVLNVISIVSWLMIIRYQSIIWWLLMKSNFEIECYLPISDETKTKNFDNIKIWTKILLGLRSKLLENEMCVTSFDTLYFLLEHSKIPATIDNNTARDPANRHKIGSIEIVISCPVMTGLQGVFIYFAMKIVLKIL